MFCNLTSSHSRLQILRSFWPAAGIERLWEQPFQACAIDEDFVKPDGQNSVISFDISKWLLQELSIPAAGQKDRRLWGRQWLAVGTELKNDCIRVTCDPVGGVVGGNYRELRRRRSERRRRHWAPGDVDLGDVVIA